MNTVIFESTVKYGSTIHYKNISFNYVIKIDCTEHTLLSNGQKFYTYLLTNKHDDTIAVLNEDNILTIIKDEYYPGDTYKLY